METVMLSGGDLGGTEVEWPEGEAFIVIDGLRYRRVGDAAVYEGVAE